MPINPTPGVGPAPTPPIGAMGAGTAPVTPATIKSRIGGTMNAGINKPMGPRPAPAAGAAQNFQALKSAAGDMRNNTSMVKAKAMGAGAAPASNPLNAMKNMQNTVGMVRHKVMGAGSAPMNGSLHAGQFGKIAGAALGAGIAGPVGMAVGAMLGGGNKSSLGASVAKPGMGMMQPLPRKF